jgi:hypothetical protein
MIAASLADMLQVQDTSDREPTRAELIEKIRAANMRARAIEGTEADPLVQLERSLDARAKALEAERLRRARRRLLWPFG